MARDLWLLNDGRIFGGGQRTTLRLATFVAESLPDRRVVVACPPESELAERCRRAGVAVAEAEFPDPSLLHAARFPRALVGLRRLLGEAADGVVVATSFRAQLSAHLAALRLRRRPPVVNLMVEQDSARRASARLVLRHFGSVLVIEDGAADAYRQRLPGVRVGSVNNVMLPAEIEAAARARTPRPDGPPIVGVLARLIPEKGVLELLDELEPCSSAWTRLLVAGPRQDEQHVRRLEARIGQLGWGERVRLLGRITDLAPFFAEVDVLVVPSVGYETQPVVIMEALAHGRPALVRAPLWSEAFTGLPVETYRSSADLCRSLGELPRATAEPAELIRRFGPLQLVEAIDATT